jgi:hypothetical protein
MLLFVFIFFVSNLYTKDCDFSFCAYLFIFAGFHPTCGANFGASLFAPNRTFEIKKTYA